MKMYSVQMESTQDIASADQCSIITKYAYKGIFVKRLLYLVKAQGYSGENLFDLLKDSLRENLFDLLNDSLASLSISLKDCIGDISDGAAKIPGQYNEVHVRINKDPYTKFNAYRFELCFNNNKESKYFKRMLFLS